MFIRNLIIATALIVPAAAQADITAKVAYRPSELSTVTGRDAVAKRIKHAVQSACYAGPSLMEETKCRNELSVDMLAKIGNDQLAAAYRVRTIGQG
ncbi:hypothetical protein SPAN111604_09130 [Sphingomonas antarctica]